MNLTNDRNKKIKQKLIERKAAKNSRIKVMDFRVLGRYNPCNNSTNLTNFKPFEGNMKYRNVIVADVAEDNIISYSDSMTPKLKLGDNYDFDQR